MPQNSSRLDPARKRRLDRLAWVLDASIPVPGIGRIGLDGLIGLVPGIGDAVGLVLSSYILIEAARLGVTPATLVRMAGNIGLETLVGSVPVIGDLFDMAWKANLRNMDLLDAHLREPARVRRRSRLTVAAVVAGLLLLLVGVLGGAALLVRAALS
jgi:hypothetical protein